MKLTKLKACLIRNRNRQILLSKSKVPKIKFYDSPPASLNGLKGDNTRPQHQSEQFWVAQKPTKGGGRYNLGSSKNGPSQKITFWGPWTYFKLFVIFDFDLNIFIFVSFIP